MDWFVSLKKKIDIYVFKKLVTIIIFIKYYYIHFILLLNLLLIQRDAGEDF